MDRSEDPRLIAPLSVALLVFVLTLLGSTNAHAAPERKKPPAYAGIFYGHLVNIQKDRSAITVRSTDESRTRKRFYLDKSTAVFVDGKRKEPGELYFGDKVAVRYFAQGPIAIADGVYVVFGEFQPKDYIVKKKIIVTPAGEGGKKEEGKHGEGGAKKEGAAKKEGGGHH